MYLKKITEKNQSIAREKKKGRQKYIPIYA